MSYYEPPDEYDNGMTYEDCHGNGCGECGECARDLRRLSDAQHCATEAAWWRDVGSVLLGLPDDDDATKEIP